MNNEEIKKISQHFPTLFKRFNKETDRGSILVISALIDKLLKQSIEARLLLPSNQTDTVTQALEGFGLNIDLAYRLGLITSTEKKIYFQLRTLKRVCIENIDMPQFNKSYFNKQLIQIIKDSDLTWQVIQTILLPIVLPNKEIHSIEEFVNLLGWRKSLQMFFALIILHKQASIKKIERISPLYISIYN